MDLTKEKYDFHCSQTLLVVELKCWSQITWVWVLFTEVPRQCESGTYYLTVGYGLGVSRRNAIFPGKGKIGSGTKIGLCLEPGKCRDWKLGGKEIVTWPIPAHPSNPNCWHVTSSEKPLCPSDQVWPPSPFHSCLCFSSNHFLVCFWYPQLIFNSRKANIFITIPQAEHCS